jgi:hypothetical protein
MGVEEGGGEEREGKEIDRCPLTVPSLEPIRVVDSAAAAIAMSWLAMTCWMNLSCSSSIIWWTL